MFLRAETRKKDGKLHRYCGIVENHRIRNGRVVQRQVLYLGEINYPQREAWCQSLEIIDQETHASGRMALFPEDRTTPAPDGAVVRGRLNKTTLGTLP